VFCASSKEARRSYQHSYDRTLPDALYCCLLCPYVCLSRLGVGSAHTLGTSAPIAKFQHPSHALLENHGFKQIVYKKYHKRCLEERAQKGERRAGRAWLCNPGVFWGPLTRLRWLSRQLCVDRLQVVLGAVSGRVSGVSAAEGVGWQWLCGADSWCSD
jgi:hypothetical protein